RPLGGAHLSSPEPPYARNVARLEQGLREAVRRPEEGVRVFLAAMGDLRWPEAGGDGMPAAPHPAGPLHHAAPTNRQQRISAARRGLTGRVDYRDTYRVGREPVSAFSRPLDPVDAGARWVDVVQDTWSIHRHPQVQIPWRQVPRVEPVGLPTSAP